MKVLALLFAALVLGACNPQFSSDQLDRFRSLCDQEANIYLVFVAAAATGRIPASVVQGVNQGHEVATGVCADPPADLASAIARVAAIYAEIAAEAARAS